MLCGPTPVVVTEDLTQLHRCPDIGQTFGAVRVGVQRRREHAAGAQLVDHEPRRLVGHLAGQRVDVRRAQCAYAEAAEHCRRASSRSAAPPTTRRRCNGRTRGQLVVDASSRHRCAGPLRRLQRQDVAGAFVAAQQRFTEPTADTSARRQSRRVRCPSVLKDRGNRVVTQRGPHRRPYRRLGVGPACGGTRSQRPQLTAMRSEASSTRAAGAPGLGDRGEQLQEVRLRVIGAAEKTADRRE